VKEGWGGRKEGRKDYMTEGRKQGHYLKKEGLYEGRKGSKETLLEEGRTL
jgi:hypothetical protein